MRLTAWEEERLLVFTAAELARRHLAAGLPLNAPEAVALICDAMLEAARTGADYAAVQAAGRSAVRVGECVPGVPSMVDEVRLEVLMDEGTRLVVLRHPVGGDTSTSDIAAAPALVPGDVEPGADMGAVVIGGERRRMRVLNTSRRTIRVSSHYPFHRVNPRLLFDRSAARGFRLALPAGESLRWAAGEERVVELTAYGGAGGSPEIEENGGRPG